MKVERLTWTGYRIPFRQPFATSLGTETERHGYVLRLVTDAGLVGFGEAAPVPGSGRRVGFDVPVLLETASQAIPGTPVEAVDDALGDVRHLHPAAVASVRCGLDTAVCDVLSQEAGMPVAVWLAGQAQEAVPVNATVALADAVSEAQAAARAQAQGFSCIKLKVGIAADLGAERERVAAVRNAIGARLKLRLDANGAWNTEEAIRTIRALEPYGLELVEQPVAFGNVQAMRQVREAVDTPIAADEDVTSSETAADVLKAGAAQVLVIKPMVVGGLREARKIIEEAQSFGASCIVTTSIDSGIGIAAALHLAATLQCPVRACGLATGALLATDLLTAPLAIHKGRMWLPDGPGLGVRLDDEALTRCSIVS